MFHPHQGVEGKSINLIALRYGVHGDQVCWKIPVIIGTFRTRGPRFESVAGAVALERISGCIMRQVTGQCCMLQAYAPIIIEISQYFSHILIQVWIA
ncbi:hypothetical protein CEXT_342741, partial [Caerostris extrusa]